MDYGKYQQLGLYPHNEESYDKVKEAFESGKDVVGIVHATGTGKSYNALQLALDNKDKKIVYVVPSKGIIEHIKQIIEDNPNLDLKRDFPNLTFRTYSSFNSLDEEEIESIPCDLLILDEFHHLGAPVWGAKIDSMIETHPNMKVFGMTAYTVRDRGTIYERDMANPETEEIFSNNVVSRYDLCDAMIDGVLPKPIYKTAYVNLLDMEQKIEDRLIKSKLAQKDKDELQDILKDIKKKIHEAPSIPELLKKSLKQNGKYIYFCPPGPQDGVNDIETIKKQTIEYLKRFIPEEDIIVYTSTSDMGELGKDNRVAFYNDKTLTGEKVDNKFRIMFAINQYNEGIHAPNVDGVIMGRGTSSDIVFYEQLGRGLNVRGNTKEQFEYYNKYTKEELIAFCNKKGIPVKDEYTKEDIIERLIAPIIIDLTNNYDYIKELEDKLGNKKKEREERNVGTSRLIYLHDTSFDIEVENKDLYEMLLKISRKLVLTWDDYYDLAKNYAELNGNLNVPYNYYTFDGKAETQGGYNLGQWIRVQRTAYRGKKDNIDYINHKISDDQILKLENLGMIWNTYKYKWDNNYSLLLNYYKEHGNLDFQYYTYDELQELNDNDIFFMNEFIKSQRASFRKKLLSSTREEKLMAIGVCLKPITEAKWNINYKIIKDYYDKHGNLDIQYMLQYSKEFKDNPETLKVAELLSKMRISYNHGKLSPTHEKLLRDIGVYLGDIVEGAWNKQYELAVNYYNHYKNLIISSSFYTFDGVNPDENGFALGSWLKTQRIVFNRGELSDYRIKKLNKIGMIWNLEEVYDAKWDMKYKLAEKYYLDNGNINFDEDYMIDGVNIDSWIKTQRYAFNRGELSDYRIKKLNKIGMIWDKQSLKDLKTKEEWERMYNLAKIHYDYYTNLDRITSSYKTYDGINPSLDKNAYPLGKWIETQRNAFKANISKYLSYEQIKKLNDIGMVWFQPKTDEKLQTERINDINRLKKRKEILNRLNSLLGTYEADSLPNKEQMQEDFINQLDSYKQRK